jgi:S-adenosylmethionine:tRNA ribosyltransferase-isomerase
MKLSDFNFKLPEEQLALYPASYRDEARMMVVDRKTGDIEHRTFKDLIDYFGKDDTLVFNNTKVFPAKLIGNKERTGAEIEVFLLRELNADEKIWDVLVTPARKIRVRNKIFFGQNDEIVAEIIDNTTSRGRTLKFLYDGSNEEFKQKLYELGQTPLPTFINREVEDSDKERFQTIFAKHIGAVSAPTAGLHFSRELMKRLEIRDINLAEITLHLGLSNFRTIDVEDLSKHKMDSERFDINQPTADLVNQTKANGKQICAVGISTFKAIESSLSSDNKLKPANAWTNKFIFPPYESGLVTSLVSNLHLPLKIPLINVVAFGGYNNMMNAYKVAIDEGYKFGSYGDAMLIK